MTITADDRRKLTRDVAETFRAEAAAARLDGDKWVASFSWGARVDWLVWADFALRMAAMLDAIADKAPDAWLIKYIGGDKVSMLQLLDGDIHKASRGKIVGSVYILENYLPEGVSYFAPTAKELRAASGSGR